MQLPRIVATAGMLAVASVAWAEGASEPASGAKRAPAASAPKRVWSRDYTTWIYPQPNRGRWIGYIRVGQSVALREPTPRRGPGCHKGFVAIEPFGYVCLDRTATLKSNGRYLRSMQRLAPRPAILPFHYALSNGAPMYRRLPSPEEWKKAERFYGAPGTFGPLSWGNRGHEKLAEVRQIPPTDEVPFFLEDGGSVGRARPLELVRQQIPLGSMLSYTHAVEHAGRTFLVSADGTVVPADRVRPFRPSKFRGVELGREGDLPIAWSRARPRPKYRRNPDGSFSPTPLRWPARSWIELERDIEPAEHAGRTYLATRDRDRKRILWIAEDDASVVRQRDKLPWGITEQDKWVIISITRGTLVAYEGKRAVYATLVSPGAGGIPIKGRNPVKMSTTPLGTNRITFKHVAATMSPEKGLNRKFWIADVPHTQYFNAPFALHTAYWHESFGEPMSAGCMNLSPRDGEHLFRWTDPQVPPGWAGAAPSSLTGKGSFVVVTR